MQEGVVLSNLARAWSGLTGQSCAFAPGAEPPAPRADDACFMLPITDCVTGFSSHPRAIVLLLMGAAESRALAAAMFGLPPDQLSAADLQDAGAELCNILSASLMECLEDASLANLGLPQALDLNRWPELSHRGERRALFELSDQPRRLVVMLTDIHLDDSFCRE